MVVVPVVKPSTWPVEDTVATPGAEEVQALEDAGLVVAESCNVFPTPTLAPPEITGVGATKTVSGALAPSQPDAFTWLT